MQALALIIISNLGIYKADDFDKLEKLTVETALNDEYCYVEPMGSIPDKCPCLDEWESGDTGVETFDCRLLKIRTYLKQRTWLVTRKEVVSAIQPPFETKQQIAVRCDECKQKYSKGFRVIPLDI